MAYQIRTPLVALSGVLFYSLPGLIISAILVSINGSTTQPLTLTVFIICTITGVAFLLESIMLFVKLRTGTSQQDKDNSAKSKTGSTRVSSRQVQTRRKKYVTSAVQLTDQTPTSRLEKR